MSDDNSMDVDDVPELLPSLMPSSSLPQAEVNEFKTQMIEASGVEDWSVRITNAGSDQKKLQSALFSVLSSCWRIVSSRTALQKNLIYLSTSNDILELVRSLNADEVEEWKNLVHIGDWEGLINHRMCLALFEDNVMQYWHRETSEITCKSISS